MTDPTRDGATCRTSWSSFVPLSTTPLRNNTKQQKHFSYIFPVLRVWSLLIRKFEDVMNLGARGGFCTYRSWLDKSGNGEWYLLWYAVVEIDCLLFSFRLIMSFFTFSLFFFLNRARRGGNTWEGCWGAEVEETTRAIYYLIEIDFFFFCLWLFLMFVRAVGMLYSRYEKEKIKKQNKKNRSEKMEEEDRPLLVDGSLDSISRLTLVRSLCTPPQTLRPVLNRTFLCVKESL